MTELERLFATRNPALTEAQVSNYEERAGTRLPPEYRSFLLKLNGGMPTSCLFPRGDGRFASVALLFGLDSLQLQRAEVVLGSHPNLLPIGLSGGGDFVLVRLSDDNIFYWERDREGAGPGNVEYLAPTIWALLDALESPAENIPDRLETIARTEDTAAVDFLLRASPNLVNRSGRNIAAEAARHGNLSLLKRCLEAGVERQRGLLTFAVQKSSRPMVEYLLSLGVDINERDWLGSTALFHCMDDNLYDWLQANGAVEIRPGGQT